MFFFFFFSIVVVFSCFFFFSSRRRHTIFTCDWSSDVCSSDLRKFPWPRSGPPLASKHVLRSRRSSAVRREHAAAAFSAECGNFSILQEPVCGEPKCLSRRPGYPQSSTTV